MQVEVGLASLGGEPRAVLLREITAPIRRPPAPATLLIALESLNFVFDSVACSQSTIETRCNFHTAPCSALVAAVHLCLRHLHPGVVLVDLLELVLGVQSPQHLADAVERGETELVGVFHPEAGGDEGPGDLGEVVLQPGRAVLRQTLQSVYSEQFDLS